MPIEKIDGTTAIQNIKDGLFASWPERGREGSRLEPLARPDFTPSFQLIPGEKIFTIGSCFARNIEVLLEKNGFEIPTRALVRADPEFAAIGHNILNNYGVPSIYNEIAWALEPDTLFQEENAFFEIYPGKFVDAHLNHALKPTSVETVRARRRAIESAYDVVRECRVVIMTLGLTECWFDKVSGFYLNTAPRRSMVRGEPDRFELHVLDYFETRSFLDRIIAALTRYGHPDVRVILTVSPVPLTATYRKQDVMMANTYSKAVLRAAAEALVAEHEHIDYFPSYESVTLSERSLALQDDQVHPTAEVVQLNVTRMVSAYVTPTTASPADLKQQISANPLAVLSLVEGRSDLLAEDAGLAVALVNAALRVRRMDLVSIGLEHVGDQMPESEKGLLRARIALANDEPATALAWLKDMPERRQSKATYWSTMLQSYVALDNVDKAQEAAFAWAALYPRSSEPYRMLAKVYAKRGDDVSAGRFFEEALSLSDDDSGLLLDYSEYLVQSGRTYAARVFLDRVKPTTPHQTQRLNRVSLIAGIPDALGKSSDTAGQATVDVA